jgi:hypothetical protein
MLIQVSRLTDRITSAKRHNIEKRGIVANGIRRSQACAYDDNYNGQKAECR